MWTDVFGWIGAALVIIAYFLVSTKRMKEFLEDLKKKYNGKRVMIIGHRATQYGLEHWINGIDLRILVTTPIKWQPGWTYII